MFVQETVSPVQVCLKKNLTVTVTVIIGTLILVAHVLFVA